MVREGSVLWSFLGELDYPRALHLQRVLREKRAFGEIGDASLFLEHPPSITLGRRMGRLLKGGSPTPIDSPPGKEIQSLFDYSARSGIGVFETDRGGLATYHGPGQLVGYFIMSLPELGMGVKDFLSSMEEILIRSLSSLGVEAGRRPGYPGVWVEGGKIASLGFSIFRGVTNHGFALNLTTDLTPFSFFTPCGIEGVRMVSLAEFMERPPSPASMSRIVVSHAGRLWKRRFLKHDFSMKTFRKMRLPRTRHP